MWKCALHVALVYAAACKGASSAPSDAAAVAPLHVEEALAKIVATCAEVRGKVETRRQGQPQWDPTNVGATFRQRDWVRTGPGGFARIRFSAGGFLEMREGTTILVDTALSVESGSLVAVAEPGAPILVKGKDGSEAKLVATAGETVTQIRLTPGSAGLEIAVTQGAVNVITRDGEQPIATGEARDLIGHRTGDVVKLIAFPKSLSPGVDARFLFVPDMKVALTWRAVPQAARYHVQVARDTEFETLAVDTDASGTTTTFVPDAVGVYAWRVAAVDAAGRVGEFGFMRRIYCEEEEPRDLLVAPPDGIKFGFADKVPRISFSWQSAGNTKSYKLVISSASDSSKPAATIVTAAQRVEVATLREGVYRWSVYAVRDNREVPIFLAPRTLIVRKQRVKAHTEKLWDTRH